MKDLLLAICFTIISSAAFSQVYPSPLELHGPLSVAGQTLVDQYGEPPQLRGVSLSWSVWQGKKYYNQEVVGWLAGDFQISLLRASMAVEPKGGYLTNPEEQLQLVTAVVDKAISEGIYVLIDWHDHNAELHLEESRLFFAGMAQKYSGVPNVIYEIYNEPAKQSWDVVKNYSVELIKTIRQYDAKNLIVIGSPHWDQDVDLAAADPIAGFDNLVYSFHFYASDPYHQEKLRAKADKALSLGLPLFVTEWGVGESTGNGVFDRDKTEAWVDWLEKNRLSWVIWNVTDKNETTAILAPGAPVQGGWSPDQLTGSGRYVRELIRSLNAKKAK